MQRLYDSGINVSVSSFHDDGFLVQLGDEVERLCCRSTTAKWADVEERLADMARIHFLHSAFANGQ